MRHQDIADRSAHPQSLSHHGERLITATRLDDSKAVWREGRVHPVPDRRVVVDDKHAEAQVVGVAPRGDGKPLVIAHRLRPGCELCPRAAVATKAQH